MGFCYFKTNLRNKPAFYPFALVSPAILLYSAYAFENLKFNYKLRNVELDKKYNINSKAI